MEIVFNACIATFIATTFFAYSFIADSILSALLFAFPITFILSIFIIALYLIYELVHEKLSIIEDRLAKMERKWAQVNDKNID